MPYAPSAHPDEALRGWVRQRLLAGGGVTVAVQGGRVAGVLAASRRDGVDWIDQRHVAADRVGRGIGRALLPETLGRAAGPVRPWTFQASAGARRFHERHGFVPIGFADGTGNEERCPDVLYERGAPRCYAGAP
jgi:GNAT superfamily N-acetyltransferase